MTHNENTDLNLSQNSQGTSYSSRDNTFSAAREFKQKLTNEQCTLIDLKSYLLLVFGTYKQAARAASISESRLHQLFTGYAIPKNPDIIKRIAFSWNVDLVVLTKILAEAERIAK